MDSFTVKRLLETSNNLDKSIKRELLEKAEAKSYNLQDLDIINEILGGN